MFASVFGCLRFFRHKICVRPLWHPTRPHNNSNTQAMVHPLRDRKVVASSLNQTAGCQGRPCATSIENQTERNYRFLQIFARKRAGLLFFIIGY